MRPGLRQRTLCREAEKEKGLLEKRAQRLEEARAAESAALGAELRAQREAVAGELSAKDNKINDLVEELGATQALLTDKEAALQEVLVKLLIALLTSAVRMRLVHVRNSDVAQCGTKKASPKECHYVHVSSFG